MGGVCVVIAAGIREWLFYAISTVYIVTDKALRIVQGPRSIESSILVSSRINPRLKLNQAPGIAVPPQNLTAPKLVHIKNTSILSGNSTRLISLSWKLTYAKSSDKHCKLSFAIDVFNNSFTCWRDVRLAWGRINRSTTHHCDSL